MNHVGESKDRLAGPGLTALLCASVGKVEVLGKANHLALEAGVLSRTSMIDYSQRSPYRH